MKTIFLLTGVELSGQVHHSANKDHTVEYKITLTVDWQNKTPDEKVKDAMTKYDLIKNGTDFVEPFSPEFVKLLVFLGNIEAAGKAILSRAKNEPNSAQALRVALKLIYDNVKNLGTMVQLKMNSCVPDEAIRMCTAAGYTYKTIAVRGKRKNSVKKTTDSGVVQFEGEGEGGRMWEWSFNPYADLPVITSAPYTTGGVTVVNTGKSKVEVFFRWRLVFRKGKYGDWSPWFSGMTP